MTVKDVDYVSTPALPNNGDFRKIPYFDGL